MAPAARPKRTKHPPFLPSSLPPALGQGSWQVKRRREGPWGTPSPSFPSVLPPLSPTSLFSSLVVFSFLFFLFPIQAHVESFTACLPSLLLLLLLLLLGVALSTFPPSFPPSLPLPPPPSKQTHPKQPVWTSPSCSPTFPPPRPLPRPRPLTWPPKGGGGGGGGNDWPWRPTTPPSRFLPRTEEEQFRYAEKRLKRRRRRRREEEEEAVVFPPSPSFLPLPSTATVAAATDATAGATAPTADAAGMVPLVLLVQGRGGGRGREGAREGGATKEVESSLFFVSFQGGNEAVRKGGGGEEEGKERNGEREMPAAGDLAPPPRAVLSLHLCQVGVVGMGVSRCCLLTFVGVVY